MEQKQLFKTSKHIFFDANKAVLKIPVKMSTTEVNKIKWSAIVWSVKINQLDNRFPFYS